MGESQQKEVEDISVACSTEAILQKSTKSLISHGSSQITKTQDNQSWIRKTELGIPDKAGVENIRKKYVEINENLEPADIADYLYKERAIHDSELEEIYNQTTRKKRVETLMEISRKKYKFYKVFYQATLDDYGHLNLEKPPAYSEPKVDKFLSPPQRFGDCLLQIINIPPADPVEYLTTVYTTMSACTVLLQDIVDNVRGFTGKKWSEEQIKCLVKQAFEHCTFEEMVNNDGMYPYFLARPIKAPNAIPIAFRVALATRDVIMFH